MKTNLDVRTVALNRAIQLLNSLNAQFKIILPDGSEHGALMAAPPGKNTIRRYPFGSVREHCRATMDTMKVGDVGFIPVGEFDLETLQSGACALASQEWGNGNYITRADTENQGVQILRVE